MYPRCIWLFFEVIIRKEMIEWNIKSVIKLVKYNLCNIEKSRIADVETQKLKIIC